jgi:hypothetical protein
LFQPLLGELIALLRSLDPDMWNRRTVAPRWRVRDVATHLLDGDLRKLAICRDGHAVPSDGPIASDRDIARLVNALNDGGVQYGLRLSEQLLVDLLGITGRWIVDYFSALPPSGPAVFAVSWAGEAQSENWMDLGREYTERFHHQMQIRDAVGRPRLLDPVWMEPLIEFSIRALPRTYEAVDAPDGTAITLAVRGETQGDWSLLRAEQTWQLRRGRPDTPATVVTVAADDVWRLFYNALSAAAIAERVKVDGDRSLAVSLLTARSVIL